MLCFLCIMLMKCINGATGVLTSVPSDVAGLNGTTFSLRCSTNTSDDLYWNRLSPGAEREDRIVEGSEVHPRFSSLYSVLLEDRTSTLTIVAEQSTAARYACIEKVTAKRATAEVIVLESMPSCSGNMTGYVIKMICSVTFSGDRNPSIIWTQMIDKEEKELTGPMETENTKTAGPLFTHTSTLMLPVNESEINQFRVYRYTVEFCLPDSATKAADDGSCVFSQHVRIAEEASETTPRTGDTATLENNTRLWWIIVIVPIVIGSLVGVAVYRHCKRSDELQHPKGQHTDVETGLVESPC